MLSMMLTITCINGTMSSGTRWVLAPLIQGWLRICFFAQLKMNIMIPWWHFLIDAQWYLMVNHQWWYLVFGDWYLVIPSVWWLIYWLVTKYLVIGEYYLVICEYYLVICEYYILVGEYYILVGEYYLLVGEYYLVTTETNMAASSWHSPANRRQALVTWIKVLWLFIYKSDLTFWVIWPNEKCQEVISTCAGVTVSALSVEAAAWKTGHFQNSGWPHVWG